MTETPSDADLKKYGLDPAAPRVKVTVTQASGEPKELSYEFGVETGDKLSVYARETGRPFVFLVNKITAENFLTIDLRDRTLFRLDRTKVQKLQIKGWKKELKAPTELILERKEGVWTASKAPDKLVIDPARVDQFVNIITAPRAMTFVPGQTPEQGFDMAKSENTLEIHVTSEGGVTHYLTLGNESDQGLNLFAWANGMKPTEVAKLPAATLRPFKDRPTAFAKQQQP